MPNPSRETKFPGTKADRKIFIFPVQLTTSRIGNEQDRQSYPVDPCSCYMCDLDPSLAICMCDHTCMRPDSHTQLPNNCLCPLVFCLYFVSWEMSLFASIMYIICTVTQIARVRINRVRLPILLVVNRAGKTIFLGSRSHLRIWSRETGSAVPSRASLLISILRLNLVIIMYRYYWRILFVRRVRCTIRCSTVVLFSG